MSRYKLLRTSVALGLLLLFPSTWVLAESNIDRRMMTGTRYSPTTERLGNRLVEHAQRLRRTGSLSPTDMADFADTVEEFAIEHSRLGNMTKVDNFIRVNLTALKANRSPEEQAALEVLAHEGVYRALFRMADALRREAGKRASLLPGAHFLPAERTSAESFCYALGKGLEAGGIALSLDPFTAPLGVILGLSGIAMDMMLHYNAAC